MRKHFRFFVCLVLVFVFCQQVFAVSSVAEPIQNESVDLDGLFPNFTQADYESGFQNYAKEESRLVLSSSDLKARTSGVISNTVGIVFDKGSIDPIQGAMVYVVNAETEELAAAVQTDATGRFQIVGLPDAFYNWIVVCDGFKVSTYYGYDVRAGEITDIFTFYLSREENIIKIYKEHNDVTNNECLIADDFISTVEEEDPPIVTTSFTSAPTLSSFTVGIDGVATTVSRYMYLTYVVAGEALGYYQCQNYNMTETQIKQYYAAQAVAANTFLEYVACVSKKHGSKYTVCNSASCCQLYDTTKTTSYVISGINTVCYKVGGDWYSYLQVYKSSGKYSYITGKYFSCCNGHTIAATSEDPSLKSVACTNINGSTTLVGHGNGMCQYGAAYLAKTNYKWDSILSYYYDSTVSLFCPW